MTTIYHYLARLEDTLLSRHEIEVQQLDSRRAESNEAGEFNACVNFYDQSMLEATEKVKIEDGEIVKQDYSYHYQKSNGDLVFRYDNAPHHPEIETFPHHKHVESDDNVIASQPPDVSKVLVEIDEIIYPE